MAREYAAAHEDWAANPPQEKDMDSWNNFIVSVIGLSISHWAGNAAVSDAVYDYCITQQKCVWIDSPP